MSRRREMPGMQTSGQHQKENLENRIYNKNGTRNIKAEKTRDKDRKKKK